MDIIELTQKLVSIPSYVDERNDESQLGAFIFEYLQGLDYLTVEKQPVEGNRFNVIAHDGHPPRLMFACHMDTVLPSEGWQRDIFGGEVEGDRLYGLGACDMKGGTASLLHALQSFQNTQGLFLLFDVDEEYYFKGMLKFIEEYDIRPEFAVFPEPGFDIGNGHRGLIEVNFKVRGKTAHAARPELGKNAILGTSRAVEHLLEKLKEYEHPSLGKTSCNLAWLKGGIDQGDEIGSRANMIPDLAEAILDIRPSRAELRASNVLDILNGYLEADGFTMEAAHEELDFGSLYIHPERLKSFEEIVRGVTGKVEYTDISLGGYGEAQLINERFDTDCVYFGPGPKELAHQVDEYVSVTELHQAREVFINLIEHFCSV